MDRALSAPLDSLEVFVNSSDQLSCLLSMPSYGRFSNTVDHSWLFATNYFLLFQRKNDSLSQVQRESLSFPIRSFWLSYFRTAKLWGPAVTSCSLRKIDLAVSTFIAFITNRISWSWKTLKRKSYALANSAKLPPTFRFMLVAKQWKHTLELAFYYSFMEKDRKAPEVLCYISFSHPSRKIKDIFKSSK